MFFSEITTLIVDALESFFMPRVFHDKECLSIFYVSVSHTQAIWPGDGLESCPREF